MKYLIAFTQTGGSARRLAQVRSGLPMLAFSPVQDTRSQLSLVWGMQTFLTPAVTHTDQYALMVDEQLLELGWVEEGTGWSSSPARPRRSRLDQRHAGAPDR